MESPILTWEGLQAECEACNRCPELAGRRNTVFGVGSREAKILFVGEAPGEQEDLKGEPFVGRAGQLLDKFLIAADMPRETVYIANMLKCRPPNNRDPQPEEQENCIGFLRRQLKLLQPKIIVCVGRIAAIRLMDENFRITRDHGKWIEKNGYLFTAVYHPSALLRDPSKKPETLTDFLAIHAKAVQLGILKSV